MKLLLDSHVYLWWTLEHPRLSARDIEAIGEAEEVAISFVTPWELELKVSRGRRKLPAHIWSEFQRDRMTFLTPTMEDCLVAAKLPFHHRDPFDRMIISQAINRRMTIATSDHVFEAYGPSVLSI